MRHVIIGNGVAGITAAQEIRERDPGAEIVLISREWDHFFSRTALMYEFCGQLSRRDLEPFERDFYDKNRFQRISKEVVKVTPNSKSILFADNSSLNYDKLLLAVGSKPVKAPWQSLALENVGHFVTLQDLEWLKSQAAGLKAHRGCAAVVGGGLIGVEVAEILLHAGIETHFIIREEWYWPIALNKAESGFVAEHMRAHGCHVHLGTEIDALEQSDGRLKSIHCVSGQKMGADLLVVAIGVRPATDFLEDIFPLTERYRGIPVSDSLETNITDIYAAGDCTSVEWFNGATRPEQLWYTARDQGRIAGRNMSGASDIYKRGILYNSAKFFDIEYTTAGLVNFDLPDTTEWYNKVPNAPISQRIIVQNGQVIGFNMLGSRWNHSYFIRWIEERRSLDWVLAHLREAAYDAEFARQYKMVGS